MMWFIIERVPKYFKKNKINNRPYLPILKEFMMTEKMAALDRFILLRRRCGNYSKIKDFKKKG